jgi:hypothetical protein
VAGAFAARSRAITGWPGLAAPDLTLLQALPHVSVFSSGSLLRTELLITLCGFTDEHE